MKQTDIYTLIRDARKPRKRSSDSVLIGRQPVFDQSDQVWGYELLFRDPLFKPGLESTINPQEATSAVILDGYELIRPSLRSQQRLFINFTAELLATEMAAVLPVDSCVIEILENVQPTDEVVTGICNLKKQGYIFALDDYVGQPHLEAFLPLVDIVKVDVLELSPTDLYSLNTKLHSFSVRKLAEKVETHDVAKRCRTLGFTLFQGFFYSKAELVKGKKFAPSQVSKTRLLTLTADAAVDITEIIQGIRSDVFLSYKLLKLINSVYYGLPMRVHSVEHAVNLLGIQRVRQWLCLTALAEINTSPMGKELACFAAQRARFLEALGQIHLSRHAPQQHSLSRLFIVGLFSLLENILHVPQKEIFSFIPLEEDVLQVLTEKTGPLAPWYNLMQAYEEGNWDQVEKIARSLGLKRQELTATYVDAGAWSSTVFASLD